MEHRFLAGWVAVLALAAMALWPSTARAQFGPKYWQALDDCNRHRDLTKAMAEDPACQEFVRRAGMAGSAIKREAGITSLMETRNRMRQQELARQQREQQRQQDSANWQYAFQAASYARAAQRAWAMGDARSARYYQGMAAEMQRRISP